MNRIGLPLATLGLVPLSVAPLVLLAACADDRAEYPSLARRPAEQGILPDTGQQGAPLETAIAEPISDSRLAGLVGQARLAHDRFAARRSRADQLAKAARGARPGSESWALASVALADLESARSDAMIALADLDQIYAAARIGGNASGSIVGARDQVMAWISEEDRALESLRANLDQR